MPGTAVFTTFHRLNTNFALYIKRTSVLHE
jgi:hypothetical protein